MNHIDVFDYVVFPIFGLAVGLTILKYALPSFIIAIRKAWHQPLDFDKKEE